MRVILAIVCCVVGAEARGQEGALKVRGQPGTPAVVAPREVAGTNEALAAELRELHRRDQGVRSRVEKLGILDGLPLPEPFLEEWSRVDAENLAALRRIVEEHGWPGISLVGTHGAMTAFLIVQHADLETQREFLPRLEAAAEAGEMSRGQLAYLVDRVRMREGKPQVYGTQLGIDAQGNVIAENLGDPEGVEERRRAAGLPPLEMYLKMASKGRAKAEGGGAPTELELQKELKAIHAEFREIGPGRFGGGVTRDESTWPAEVRAAREAVRVRVREVVARALEDGYPTAARVGEDGTRAFFSLVSELDLKEQERTLVALEWAASRGEASRAQLAWLTDKVRVGQGKGQVYGTQFVRGDDGAVVPLPIEDEAGVAERRAAAGLPAMEATLAALNGAEVVEEGPRRVIVK